MVSGTDWALVWEFLWPILRQGLIALLMAILALLGYDKVVPSRFERSGGAAAVEEELAGVMAAVKPKGAGRER